MTNDKIELKDVLNFFEYEKVREEKRARIIELKGRRRVSIGRHLSFVFENRDTLLFQIQEMCRVERITDDARVQDELDVRAFAETPTYLVVDHPAERARVELPAEARAELLQDLRG
jgi:hypothetical protein